MSINENTQNPKVIGAARTRPFTSQEFMESLRDGREIWIYGERVKDVTTHPAFRNTVRMLARLYDALHDQRKSILCTETDTGNGGYTHKFFKAARNAEEMVGARDAIAEWARVTYGWMGRSPDYKAAFLATLGANSEFYTPYQENARRWYKKVQEEVTFVNHAIVNPPVDRNKELVRGARCLHARREGDGWRLDRQRREGGGYNVHAYALQLHREQWRAANQDQGFRLRVHRTHERTGRQALLPPVL